MVKKLEIVVSTVLVFMTVVMLTGCPAPWEMRPPDETTSALSQEGGVCFRINDPKDFYPVDININPRGTLPINKHFIILPALKIIDGMLCIPPSFYRFPDNGEFLVEFALRSRSYLNVQRNFVMVIAFDNRHLRSIRPDDSEILREYSEIIKYRNSMKKIKSQ